MAWRQQIVANLARLHVGEIGVRKPAQVFVQAATNISSVMGYGIQGQGHLQLMRKYRSCNDAHHRRRLPGLQLWLQRNMTIVQACATDCQGIK